MHIVAKVAFNALASSSPHPRFSIYNNSPRAVPRLPEKYRYPGVPSGWFVLHSQKAFRASGCAALLPPPLSFSKSLDFYGFMGA